MRKPGLGKMLTWQRWFTISTLSICCITGIAFLIGREFQISRQTLGTHSVLALHGITSALALIAFGTVLPFHIKTGLKAWKNLISGILQMLFLVILVLSVLFLYYGSEELHDSSKIVHWVLGIVFFIIFIFHVSNQSIRR